jgi:sugar diacid utilization regulator
VAGPPAEDGPVREQLSALRSMLVLAMLLTQEDNQDSILHLVAHAVESLGSCTAEGIFLDGRWEDIRLSRRRAASLPALGLAAEAGAVTLAGVHWSWAYSLSSRHGPAGYLLVGAQVPPAEVERFLLQVLAQQAGVALANARLHAREREQAEELRVANLALQRSMEIHDRLTKVALGGEGQQGIAEAIYELTERAAAIEDRFGNLLAWAGPGRPEPYPRAEAEQRNRLLDRAIAVAGPVWEGEHLYSVAVLGGAPVGMLVLHDPDWTAGHNELVALEHATTVLAMEIARLHSLAESDSRLRTNLVLDLVAGADKGMDEVMLLNRAQALQYDLGRPHRVVVVEAHSDDEEIDLFMHAVGRSARAVKAGSLLAPRLHDVILLADAEVSWDLLRARTVAELHGGQCRIGVGGRCLEPGGFPLSCHEAELALRMQKAAGGLARVTVFDDLGIYKVLATVGDTSAMERFVTEWLGRLIDYDSEHGTPLVLTLSEYLDRGGNYDASARALSVHRSTLKYRLRRIRQVSGHDLGQPDIQFNLQVATRAWRTLEALRLS